MNKIILLTLIICQSSYALECNKTKLETFELLNKLNFNLKNIESLESLSSLNLYQQCQGDDFINHLCNTPNIESLTIANDNCPKEKMLTGKNFEQISNLTKLKFIDFDYNNITPKSLLYLKNLPNLTHIKLLGNEFGKKEFIHLKDLKFKMEIGDNSWEKATISELKEFLEKAQAPYINFSLNTEKGTLNDENVAVAFREVAISDQIKSIKFAGNIPTDIFANLTNSKLERIYCTGHIEFKLNTNLFKENKILELGCPLETDRDLKDFAPYFNQLRSFSIRNLTSHDELDLVGFSSLKEINIAPEKFAHSLEHLDLKLDLLQNLLTVNKELKVNLPYKTNFYSGDQILNKSQTLKSLQQLCGDSRCSFYIAGKKLSLKMAIRITRP